MGMFSTIINNIKKITFIVCIFAIATSLTSCKVSEDKKTPKDKAITSLGEFEDCVFFSSGGFQDYTDYAKYYYDSVNLTENKYLKKVQESDLIRINQYVDDFEEWIETIKDGDASNKIVVNYDFNRAIIDMEDYIYIDSEEHTWSDDHTSYVKYNIYYFDAQTQVLYYFHNNI